MNKCLTLLFLSLSFTALSQSSSDFYLKEKSHDFGDVNQGEVVQWILEFENRGKDTIEIKNVITECGCTVPKWDSTAIYPPSSLGIIKIILDTKGKQGIYNKNVHIELNKGQRIKVPLRANILPKKS
jgi:hypothetical protein